LPTFVEEEETEKRESKSTEVCRRERERRETRKKERESEGVFALSLVFLVKAILSFFWGKRERGGYMMLSPLFNLLLFRWVFSLKNNSILAWRI